MSVRLKKNKTEWNLIQSKADHQIINFIFCLFLFFLDNIRYYLDKFLHI